MLPEFLWLLGRHLFFSSNTRIFLATLQLAYLFFHGLLHPHYADNLYYLSNHRSETEFIRSAVPIKIVIKRRAKQLEGVAREQKT